MSVLGFLSYFLCMGRASNMCLLHLSLRPYTWSIGTGWENWDKWSFPHTYSYQLELLHFIFRQHCSSIIIHPIVLPHPHKTNCNSWCLNWFVFLKLTSESFLSSYLRMLAKNVFDFFFNRFCCILGGKKELENIVNLHKLGNYPCFCPD